MKRIIAEVVFEIMAWIILILWAIASLLKLLIKKIVYVYKKKELVKRYMRTGYLTEVERFEEEDTIEEIASQKIHVL